MLPSGLPIHCIRAALPIAGPCGPHTPAEACDTSFVQQPFLQLVPYRQLTGTIESATTLTGFIAALGVFAFDQLPPSWFPRRRFYRCLGLIPSAPLRLILEEGDYRRS